MAQAMQGRQMVGAELQRVLEQLARSLRALAARRLVHEREAAHRQVDRVGIVRPLALDALALRLDERHIHRVRDAPGDAVLHGREPRDISFEPLRPKLGCAFSLDQLRVDAHRILRPAHAAAQHVADRQVPPDLPHVDPLVLVGERGVQRNDE